MEISNDDILETSQAAVSEDAQKYKLMIFSNDKSNPFPSKQLEMFYRAVIANKVGIMHAKNVETDAIETLLIGFEQDAGELITYPLAKILSGDELNLYLPPDGEGGYLNDAVREVTVN